MTKDQLSIVLSALDMKLASVKRAEKSNNSPRFAEVYKLEADEINKTIAEIKTLKVTQ